MRIIVSMLLAYPIYMELGFDSIWVLVSAVLLQFLAGLDFKFSRK